MQIHHLAIWTPDLERLKAFYVTYFGAQPGARYSNPAKNFTSYFLTFTAGACLELMHRPDIPADRSDSLTQPAGYTHLALAVGSEVQVDQLTARLQHDGFRVVSGPRHTGDGYYESVVLDPDGNQVEITV